MASDSEASCVSDPNFAVICSFLEKFGASCGITSPDFLELQEMLENTQEVSPELIDLHVKLLRKVRRSVSVDRWERVLIKLCHVYCSQDAWELERFGYKKARLSSKLRILKILMEIQFDLNVKFKAEVNRLTANELRTEPIGRDKHGHSYWYQIDESCQLRVYREDPDEETWALVANDREGLVRLISQLASDDPNLAELVLNEDSNSLEIEKPILDTGQISSSSNGDAEVDESSGGNEDSKDIPSEPQTEASPDETSPIESSPLETSPVETSNTETSTTENIAVDEIKQNIEGPENLAVNDVKKDDIALFTTKGIDLSAPQTSVQQQARGVDLSNKRKKNINDLATNLRLKSHDMLYKNPVQEQEIDLSLKKPRMDPKQFSSLSVPPFEPMSIESALRMSTDFQESDEELEDEEDEYYDEDEIDLPSHMKQPRLDRPTLLGNTKKKSYSDEDDEYGEEIEEPMMLIQGEGSGKECENENIQINNSEEYSDVVEEPVMYFYGEGSGYDCDTGNTGKENEDSNSGKNSNDSESANSNTLDSVCAKEQDSDLKTVTDTKSATSSKTVLEVTDKQKTETCVDSDIKSDSAVSENKAKEISPKSHKIGTVMIDVKSSSRSHTSDAVCPKKSSRWDIGKPADGDKLENENEDSTKSELCNDSTNSSIKNKENSEVKLLNVSKDETDNTISDISSTDIKTDVNTKRDLEILNKHKQDTDKENTKVDNKNNLTVLHSPTDKQEVVTDQKPEEINVLDDSEKEKKQPMFFFGPGCFQFKTPMPPYKPDVKNLNIHKSDDLQNKTDQECITKTEKINTISESVPICINKADILVDNKEQITNTHSSEQKCSNDSKLDENIKLKENIITEKEPCGETDACSSDENVEQNVNITDEIKDTVCTIETELESTHLDNKDKMPREESREIDNNLQKNIENSNKENPEENETSNTNTDLTEAQTKNDYTESPVNNVELLSTTQEEIKNNISEADIDKDEIQNDDKMDNNTSEKENKIDTDCSNEEEKKIEIDVDDSDKNDEKMEIIVNDSNNDTEKMEIESGLDSTIKNIEPKESDSNTIKEQSNITDNENLDVIDEPAKIESDTNLHNIPDKNAQETNIAKESIESVAENTNTTEEKSTLVTKESKEIISETSSCNIAQETLPSPNQEINIETTQCAEVGTSNTKTQETVTFAENKVNETEVNLDVTSLSKKEEEITDDKSETLSETLESLSTLIEGKSEESTNDKQENELNDNEKKEGKSEESTNDKQENELNDNENREGKSEESTNDKQENELSDNEKKEDKPEESTNDKQENELNDNEKEIPKNDNLIEPDNIVSVDDQNVSTENNKMMEETVLEESKSTSEDVPDNSEISSSVEPVEKDNSCIVDESPSNINEESKEIAPTVISEDVREISSSIQISEEDISDPVCNIPPNINEESNETDSTITSENVKEISSSVEIIEKDISETEDSTSSNISHQEKEIEPSEKTEEVERITSSIDNDNSDTVEEITSSNLIEKEIDSSVVCEEVKEISSSVITDEKDNSDTEKNILSHTNDEVKDAASPDPSVEETDSICFSTSKESVSDISDENKEISSTENIEENITTTIIEKNEIIKSDSETETDNTHSKIDNDDKIDDANIETKTETDNNDTDVCVEVTENQEFVSSTASVSDDVQSVTENIDTSEDMEIDDIEISSNIKEYKSNIKSIEIHLNKDTEYNTSCNTENQIRDQMDEKSCTIVEKDDENSTNINQELVVIESVINKTDIVSIEEANTVSNVETKTDSSTIIPLSKTEESNKLNTENENITIVKPELSKIDSKEIIDVNESENEVDKMEDKVKINSEPLETNTNINTQIDIPVSNCETDSATSKQVTKSDEIEEIAEIQDEKIVENKIDSTQEDPLDFPEEKVEVCRSESIDLKNDTMELENKILPVIKSTVDVNKSETTQKEVIESSSKEIDNSTKNESDDLLTAVNEQHVSNKELLKKEDINISLDIAKSSNSAVENTKLNSNTEENVEHNLHVETKKSEIDKQMINTNHVNIEDNNEHKKTQENFVGASKQEEPIKELITDNDNVGKTIKPIEINTLEPHINEGIEKIDSMIENKQVIDTVEEKEIKSSEIKENVESDSIFYNLKMNDQITISNKTQMKENKINIETVSFNENKDDSSDDDIMDSCGFDENDFNDDSENEQSEKDNLAEKIHLIEQKLNHTEIKVMGTENKIILKDINELIDDKNKFLDPTYDIMKPELIINKAGISTAENICKMTMKTEETMIENNLNVDKSGTKTEKKSPILSCVDITKLQKSSPQYPEHKTIVELKQQSIISSPTSLESIGIDNDDSNDVIDVPETDPLACTEEELLMSKKMEEESLQSKSPGLSLATFKLDDTEDTDTSALIPEPIARALRNRKISIEATTIKNRKRSSDSASGKNKKRSRHSANISSQADSSSDEENNEDENPPEIKVTPQRGTGKARRGGRGRGRGRINTEKVQNDSPAVSSDPQSETSRAEIAEIVEIAEITEIAEASPVEQKPPTVKKKRRVLGLDIDPAAIIQPVGQTDSEEPTTRSSIRQSRRIAQLKIKEEAERRKIEELTQIDLKDEKKKKKKDDDKDYRADKKKKKYKSEDDESEEEIIELSKRKHKKKRKEDLKKLFNMANPWQSSSESSTSHEEEEEDEVEEEPSDDEAVLKSDHEFSPESDLENNVEVQPLRRARTVKKESDTEDPTDEHACQKCGKADHPEWILLCDKCDCGWHCSCLRPALLVIPEGDWFCPPCQHVSLVEALKTQLIDYDKKMNRREMEVRRKQRLAYVGISLDNVLSSKETEDVNQEDDDNDQDQEVGSEEESSESESGSESGSSSGDESEPIYQLRERRQAHSYRFNDYDELINSAIQDELEAVKGAGNQGRGKDIATIVNAEKEEAKAQEALLEQQVQQQQQQQQPEVEQPPPVVPVFKEKVVQEVEPEPSEEDSEDERPRVVPKHGGRKKHRKLNSLDISSEDDPDDDEDFKGTSASEEEDFEDLGSDDSDELDIGRRGKGKGITRRSTRARTTRYDREFINDDSEDEPPKRKKSKSIWDESESEESDKSWGRRKRNKKQRQNSMPKPIKKSRKKKRRIDDSDPEVKSRTKKPKIKYGGLNDSDDEELLTRRTRGKKINYIDALGSDSDEDKRKPKPIESEDEYVANEEEDDDAEEAMEAVEEEEKDSESESDKLPMQRKIIKIIAPSKAGKGRGKGGIPRPQHLKQVPPTSQESGPLDETLEDMEDEEEDMDEEEEEEEDEDEIVPPVPANIPVIAANPDDLNEEEVGTMMMENEEYAKKQLELMAIQLAKEKKKKEKEAKKLAEKKEIPIPVPMPPVVIPPPVVGPKKRGRKKKSEIEAAKLAAAQQQAGISPMTVNPALMQHPGDKVNPLLTGSPEIPATVPTVVSDLTNSPPKRRGRGKGKKTLAAEAAAAASTSPTVPTSQPLSGTTSPNIVPPQPTSVLTSTNVNAMANMTMPTSAQNDPQNLSNPNLHGKLGIAAPPQPFSQNQPTPSVITRMLQSQPISAQTFTTSGNAMNQKYFPPGMPPDQQAPRGSPSGQFSPIAGRGRVPSPYRQSPPAMGMYPGVRPMAPNSPHRLRSPGPPNMQMFHSTHHSMDPSPSGGGPINIASNNRDRNSPGNVTSPMTSKEGPTPPPPPYSRALTVNRFSPNESSPGPSLPPPIRHHMFPQAGAHMQQPSPPPRPPPPGNFSPYHPPPPPNYHYGAYPPAPSLAAADDALPPTDYQGSPYPEHYNTAEGTVHSSEGSNSKPFDEEGSGEFGGLVSYFSSQREDDLDT